MRSNKILDSLSKVNIEAEKSFWEELLSEVPDKGTKNDLKNEGKIETKKIDRSFIKDVNNQVLIDFLSPEISKNEESKRKHKGNLITLLTVFLVVQFLAVVFLSNKAISYAFTTEADADIVNSLLTFVSAYITSVVVEMIAILKYIVKNVFDTSLVDLVKIFKNEDDGFPKKQDKK